MECNALYQDGLASPLERARSSRVPPVSVATPCSHGAAAAQLNYEPLLGNNLNFASSNACDVYGLPPVPSSSSNAPVWHGAGADGMLAEPLDFGFSTLPQCASNSRVDLAGQ